jgi:hypothetical protein
VVFVCCIGLPAAVCWARLDLVAGAPVFTASVVPTTLLPPSLPLPFELLLPEPPELGLRLLWLPLLEVLFVEWELLCRVPPTAPPTTPPMTSTMAMTIAVMPQRVRYHGVFANCCSWPFSSCPCLRAEEMAPGL